MIRTEILNIAKQKDIKRAITLIKQGELVAVQTETVYGLAGDAKNNDAIKKIFIAKGRPTTHPLILHIDSIEKLPEWVEHIPDTAKILAKRFWPGPLTLLLNKKATVSESITGGLKTIAIRIPNNTVLRDMMCALNTALVAPSANPHTKLSPTSAEHVIKSLYGKIAAVLDGGTCSVGIESTILDLTGKIPTILRKGPISAKEIQGILALPVQLPQEHSQSISGNMLNHYQPNTKSLLKDTGDMIEYLSANSHKNIGVMYYSDFKIIDHQKNAIKVSSNKHAYGKILYKTLHELDQHRLDEIVIESPPESDEWGDILDRLRKAVN